MRSTLTTTASSVTSSPPSGRHAFVAGCKDLAGLLGEIDGIGISGTTPGMTAMAADGAPLYPAILMLDQRSRAQAVEIIDTIGLARILEETSNMPVAGGCSLASILWLRDHQPEAFRNAACFGHTNTYFAKWLTGEFAIDPSSASLTALYNTVKNDLTWNADIASAFGIKTAQLPRSCWRTRARDACGAISPVNSASASSRWWRSAGTMRCWRPTPSASRNPATTSTSTAPARSAWSASTSATRPRSTTSARM